MSSASSWLILNSYITGWFGSVCLRTCIPSAQLKKAARRLGFLRVSWMTETGTVSLSVGERKAGGAQCDCTCLLLSNESNVKILKVKKMKRSRAREEILLSTSWGETFDGREHSHHALLRLAALELGSMTYAHSLPFGIFSWWHNSDNNNECAVDPQKIMPIINRFPLIYRHLIWKQNHSQCPYCIWCFYVHSLSYSSIQEAQLFAAPLALTVTKV